MISVFLIVPTRLNVAQLSKGLGESRGSQADWRGRTCRGSADANQMFLHGVDDFQTGGASNPQLAAPQMLREATHGSLFRPPTYWNAVSPSRDGTAPIAPTTATVKWKAQRSPSVIRSMASLIVTRFTLSSACVTLSGACPTMASATIR